MSLSEEKNYFIAAVMFFTRIPVPKNTKHSEEILNQSRKYFTLVGLIIGSIASISVLLFNEFLPLSISVLISMLITILVTGAFHEDGFADCCDGFGGGWQKYQVLAIMKDSRVGTYAVVGLIMVLSLKFFALIEIGLLSVPLLLIVYINGHTISRFGASMCVHYLDYVQDSDKSKVKPITTQRLSTKNIAYSALFVLPALFILTTFNAVYVLTLAFLLMVFILGNHYFKKRIGGYTGDCLGAMQQALEVTFYLSILVLS